MRQEAIDDLNNIWRYTFEKWSENQANKYYGLIKQACKDIGENLKVGKEYTRINNGLLGLKSGKHIIFYNLNTENEIDVVRILHQSMDLKNRITNSL